MSVTLGPKVPPSQVPVARDEADSPVQQSARQDAKKADAKQGETRLQAKREGAGSAQLVAEGGAAPILDPQVFSDLLIKNEGAALLSVLATPTATSQEPEEANGSTAAQAFASCKPLLGAPSDKAIAERFEHPELSEAAAVPLALSEAGMRLVVEMANAKEGAPPSTQVLSLAENVTVVSRARGLDEASARTKAVHAQVQKVQALCEKMLARLPDAPPPNAPASIAKQLQLAAPQIAAAAKQLQKAIETGFDKRSNPDTDIEIPGPALVALEASLASVIQSAKLGGAKIFQSEAEHLELMKSLSATDMKLVEQLRINPELLKKGPQQVPPPQPQGDSRAVGGASSAAINFSSGFNMETCDIEAAIYWVMMQSAKTETDMLRDQMKEMQKINAQKAELRAKKMHMREEQIAVNDAMRKEYDYLVESGAISESTTFEAYQAWRKVTWTPEGDAALEQPMPALPDDIVFGPSGPPEPPGYPEPTGSAEFPCDPAVAKAIAEKFGVSANDIAYLFSYWCWVEKNGESTAFSGMPVGPDGQPLDPRDPAGLELLIQLTAGILPGKEPAENQRRIDSFFEDTVNLDTTVDRAQSSPSAGKGSGRTATPEAPADAAWLNDVGYNMPRADLRAAMEAAIRTMFVNDPDMLALLDNPGLEQMFKHSGQYEGELTKFFQKLTSVCKDSRLYGMAMVLAGREGVSIITPHPINWAKSLGADPAAMYGGKQLPAKDGAYTDYKNQVAGNGDYDTNTDNYLANELLNMLKYTEPFKSSGRIKELLAQITQASGSFEQFLAGDDFDDTAHERSLMAQLINEVNKQCPMSQPVMILCAFIAEYGDDDLDYFNSACDVNPSNVGAKLQDARTKRGEKGTEAEAAAPAAPAPEQTEPPPEPGSSSSFLEGRNGANQTYADITEARAAAEQAERQARAAAKEGAQNLTADGQQLEDVKGAVTGTATDFDLAIQKVDDQMVGLSEVTEMEQVRLQILMDRRAKLMETLSNVIKKMASTKETLSANQK